MQNNSDNLFPWRIFKNQFACGQKGANCTRFIFKNTHRGLIQRLVIILGSHLLLLLYSNVPTRLRPCGTKILFANSVLSHSSLISINFCFLVATVSTSAPHPQPLVFLCAGARQHVSPLRRWAKLLGESAESTCSFEQPRHTTRRQTMTQTCWREIRQNGNPRN